MSAIRLARDFTGRDKIVKFEGCYHGHSDSLLVKAGSGALTLGVPTSPGVPADLAQHTLTLEYNNASQVDFTYQPGRSTEDIWGGHLNVQKNLPTALPAFLNARVESGFEIFATAAEEPGVTDKAGSDHLQGIVAATHIDNNIGRTHNIFIMFNNQDSVAQIFQLLQYNSE